MKRYHEVAHIKDGNKIVGYIVKEGLAEHNTPYRIMNLEQFTKAVQADIVQYFVYKNGRLMIQYTDEEKVYMSQRNFPLYTGKEYYAEDISYTQQDINGLLQNGKGILKLYALMDTPYVGRCVSFTLFAPKDSVRSFNNLLTEQNVYRSVFGASVKSDGNWISLALPVTDFSEDILGSKMKSWYKIDTKELFKKRAVVIPGIIRDEEVIKETLKSRGVS